LSSMHDSQMFRRIVVQYDTFEFIDGKRAEPIPERRIDHGRVRRAA
jgi:hypothetical protein